VPTPRPYASPNLLAEVLFDIRVVVVTRDRGIERCDVAPELLTKCEEHRVHHQGPVLHRVVLSPTQAFDVHVELGGPLIEPSQVLVTKTAFFTLRNLARHMDRGLANRLADVYRSGVQHHPHGIRLIQAQLDEVVASAERSELVEHALVTVLSDHVHDRELLVAAVELLVGVHQLLFEIKLWCGRPDCTRYIRVPRPAGSLKAAHIGCPADVSNRHRLRDQLLGLACLPVPPRASKIVTRSWALTLVLAANLNRVFDAQTDPAHLPLHVREQTRVRDLGREPMINFKLLNSVLDEQASQGTERKAHDACRGLHLAGGTLVGFCADSERDLRWLWLPLGAPSGLSPSGLGSLKAVTEWVGSRVRDNRSRTAMTSYP
jgi:hypothetical protein